ncbi:MAG: LacI family DNA-binding transcriptional regulator [Phycisphaerales bacterium]
MSIPMSIDTYSRLSFADQIEAKIRRDIRSQRLRPGQRLPTLQELSQQLDVSVGTVKNAVSTLVKEGYLTSRTRRGIFVSENRLSKSSIALVLPCLSSANILAIMDGVKQGLAGSDAKLMIEAADLDFDQEMELVERLDSSTVAGAVIYPPPQTSYVETLREVRKRGIPFVMVPIVLPGVEADSVAGAWRDAGRLAAEHLLTCGHRRIGLVDDTADSVGAIDARKGMDQALRQAGLAFADLSRVVISATDLNADQPWLNAQRATERLLADHPDVTAIIGFNGPMTLGVLRGVKAMGRRVPQDLSVIGLSDMDVLAVTEPPVTMVDVDPRLLGRLAAERLLEVLSGEGGEVKHIEIQPHLIERQSVARVMGS